MRYDLLRFVTMPYDLMRWSPPDLNWVKVVTGHDLDIHCSTLAIDASLENSWKFVKWFREKDLYGHGSHLGNVT